jgi:hypothetical protein
MSGMSGMCGPDGPVRWVTVEVLGIPLDLHVRATEHAADLTREFTLIQDRLQHTDGPPSVPQRLLQLIDTLSARYSSFGQEQEDLLDAAVAAGRPTLDLTFRLPADGAEAARQLGDVLDEADEYCRQGRHLLTLATPDELVAYRRWYLAEFVRQTAGEAPRPWSAAAAAPDA